MVNRLKVAEAAEKLGVSRVTVYKYLKKHGNKLVNHVNKVDGTTYLSSRGVELLRGLLTVNNNVNNGFTGAGSEAAGVMESVVADLRGQVSFLQSQVERIQEAAWEKERRSDTIIMQLTNQLRDSQLLIEDLRQQRQEVIVPEYVPEEVQEVQNDIMDVDAAVENLVQDVVIEVCEEPPAAAAEPARESLETKEQGPAPVMKKAVQPDAPPAEQEIATSVMEKIESAKQEKVIEKQLHPKHSWGLFKRLWVNMFQPELLREV